MTSNSKKTESEDRNANNWIRLEIEKNMESKMEKGQEEEERTYFAHLAFIHHCSQSQ